MEESEKKAILEQDMEQLFDALLDEPVYYEAKKGDKTVKIPIHSLGLNAFKIISKLEFDKLPEKILEKLRTRQELTEEEKQIANDRTMSQLQSMDADSPAMELILDTLKLTFPNKSNEDLMRIGTQHFQGLLNAILKANNLASKSYMEGEEEKTDFQNSQPEQNR